MSREHRSSSPLCAASLVHIFSFASLVLNDGRAIVFTHLSFRSATARPPLPAGGRANGGVSAQPGRGLRLSRSHNVQGGGPAPLPRGAAKVRTHTYHRTRTHRTRRTTMNLSTQAAANPGDDGHRREEGRAVGPAREAARQAKRGGATHPHRDDPARRHCVTRHDDECTNGEEPLHSALPGVDLRTEVGVRAGRLHLPAQGGVGVVELVLRAAPLLARLCPAVLHDLGLLAQLYLDRL